MTWLRNFAIFGFEFCIGWHGWRRWRGSYVSLYSASMRDIHGMRRWKHGRAKIGPVDLIW